MQENHSEMVPFPEGKPLRPFLDIPSSLVLGAAVGARPNQCYVNAWRVLIEFPERFEHDGRFVEGWFVIEQEDEVIVNEHGWCEQADGTIIDPSILLLVPSDQPVFYFPGVVRSWQETEALEGEWFPQVRFDGVSGPDGLGHPAYKAAYDAAHVKARTLANATTPPKKLVVLQAQDLEESPDDDAPVVLLILKHDTGE